MRNWFKAGAAALAMVFLAGCAGTKFVRPTEAELELGKTTEQQVLARLGKPFQEATGLSNGKAIKTLGYAYASMGNQPKNQGNASAWPGAGVSRRQAGFQVLHVEHEGGRDRF